MPPRQADGLNIEKLGFELFLCPMSGLMNSQILAEALCKDLIVRLMTSENQILPKLIATCS